MKPEETWSAERLREALERGEPVTVLDLRPDDQRAEWWIPGSHHLPAMAAIKAGDVTKLAAASHDWPREAPVVAVCAMGLTSRMAMQPLRQLGFHPVSLAGGMQQWSEAWNSAEVRLPAGSPAILQVRRTGKGCLSYLVGSEGEAAVIDASVAPQVYVELARQRNLKILATLDTHVHADHVSRSHAVAEATGARVYLPAQDRVKLPFEPLTDGARIRVGATDIEAVATPGHTGESMSYLVGGVALLTGDTLFVKGVGRPDLKAASREESVARARLLYRSLRERIFSLPDSLVVLPCHTGEPVPFDGVAVAAGLPEARAAARMEGKDEESFVSEVLAHIPADPPNHMRIVRVNEGLEPAPKPLYALEAGANRCAVTQG